MFSFQQKTTKYANRKKNPTGNRNFLFQFSVRVANVKFNRDFKVAVMNIFKELKETMPEEVKEGRCKGSVSSNREYQ